MITNFKIGVLICDIFEIQKFIRLFRDQIHFYVQV